MSEQKDAIRPNYYKRFGVESVDITEQMYGTRAMIPICLATAFYYITRIGDKDGNPLEQEKGKSDWWLNKAEEYKCKINSGNEVVGVFSLAEFLSH